MFKVISTMSICSLLLSLCYCKAVWVNTSMDNDSVGATTVAQLQITSTDLSGWTQADFNTYSGTALRGPLDGGADQYINGAPGGGGMIDAAIQDLNGPLGKSVRVFGMDYGNEISSIAMQKSMELMGGTSLVNIPYFSDTLAEGSFSSGIGGINVWAHFNKFYIEISVSNCQNQNEAIQIASLFLQIYQSKID